MWKFESPKTDLRFKRYCRLKIPAAGKRKTAAGKNGRAANGPLHAPVQCLDGPCWAEWPATLLSPGLGCDPLLACGLKNGSERKKKKKQNGQERIDAMVVFHEQASTSGSGSSPLQLLGGARAPGDGGDGPEIGRAHV